MANGTDNAGAAKVNYKDLPPLEPGVNEVMKTEFGISFWLSVIYFIFILGVPILNWTAPDLMKTKIWGGMSLTWFLTSIVAMVLAFVIAWLHVNIYQKKFGSDIEHPSAGLRKGVYH